MEPNRSRTEPWQEPEPPEPQQIEPPEHLGQATRSLYFMEPVAQIFGVSKGLQIA